MESRYIAKATYALKENDKEKKLNCSIFCEFRLKCKMR